MQEEKKTHKRGRRPLGLVRINTRCTKLQSSFIKAYSAEYGISESELVRKIIDSFMKQEEKNARKADVKNEIHES